MSQTNYYVVCLFLCERRKARFVFGFFSAQYCHISIWFHTIQIDFVVTNRFLFRSHWFCWFGRHSPYHYVDVFVNTTPDVFAPFLSKLVICKQTSFSGRYFFVVGLVGWLEGGVNIIPQIAIYSNFPQNCHFVPSAHSIIRAVSPDSVTFQYPSASPRTESCDWSLVKYLCSCEKMAI